MNSRKYELRSSFLPFSVFSCTVTSVSLESNFRILQFHLLYGSGQCLSVVYERENLVIRDLKIAVTSFFKTRWPSSPSIFCYQQYVRYPKCFVLIVCCSLEIYSSDIAHVMLFLNGSYLRFFLSICSNFFCFLLSTI